MGLGTDPEWWRSGVLDGRPMLDFLRQRDIGAVFRFLRARGWSRAAIAAATGLTETRVRQIAQGKQKITSYDVLERIADGLHIDRGLIGLAYIDADDTARARHESAIAAPPGHLVGQPTAPAAAAYADHDDTGVDEADGLVRRRNVWTLAGVVVAGAALEAGVATALEGLADALFRLRPLGGRQPESLRQAARAVATAKRGYQSGRYPEVLASLPVLLSALRDLETASAAEEVSRCRALSAEAYHVTASVLLKVGDVSLAAIAADRSLHAARRSGDAVAVAASARIVVHTLMSAGHTVRAHRLAGEAAATLDRQVPRRSSEAASVAGALLLRGAIAAAQAEDRARAHDLLDEADLAARGVNETANLRWTGFNSPNVALHRVNVALTLGDAGTAIDIAQRIDPASVSLAERRACLHLDVAQAYAQWGKWDRAWSALFDAEVAAPYEVRTRPAARHLIADLARRAPRSLQPHATQLARRAGVAL